MNRTLALLVPLVPAAALAAQTPAGRPAGAERDWRLPFRSPARNVAPPEAVYRHLRIMHGIAERTAPDALSFVDGVEVVADPEWQRAREALAKERIDPGYLSAILRDSRMDADRELAFYGAFFLENVRDVLLLVEHIAGEPSRRIREAAWRRAVPWLEEHLPTAPPGPTEGGHPPRPHGLDPVPFVALLDADDPRDQVQGAWFLGRLAEIRPPLGRDVLGLAKDRLRELALGEEPMTRRAARDLLALLDPDEDREPPADDAETAEVEAWISALVRDVFPPIRRLSEGLFELHASPDLDRLVAVGAAGLSSGTLVTPADGAQKNGLPFRGLRIRELPEPLDGLGLAIGDVVTAVNGAPVTDAKALLELLRASLPARRSFLVEFLGREREPRAIEYRLR